MCTSSNLIPDITRILGKYNLMEDMLEFMNNQRFPTKLFWNSIIEISIMSTQERKSIDRISADDDFLFFPQQIYQSIALHHALKIAGRYPNVCVAAKYVIDLCVLTVETPKPNSLRKSLYALMIKHVFTSCDSTLDIINEMWSEFKWPSWS